MITGDGPARIHGFQFRSRCPWNRVPLHSLSTHHTFRHIVPSPAILEEKKIDYLIVIYFFFNDLEIDRLSDEFYDDVHLITHQIHEM